MTNAWAWTLLAVVVAERVGELYIARRNTARLLADGGYEVGEGHYPVIVGVHMVWFVALGVWLATGSRPFVFGWFGVFAVAQILRAWVMLSLGKYWTTRIIVVPTAPLIRRGPYRWLAHPNYLIVVIEIFTLPMVFGAWLPAVVFSLANGVVLWVRISAEDEALASRRALDSRDLESGAGASTVASAMTTPPDRPPSATPH
ncbi:MAG: hypothetical protein KDE14_05895 [Rhodobacteraceae bacterium]|nr:hypothetical protein [Paracoccaceae bacterium]